MSCHDRMYIFIQLMYNINDHLANRSIFVGCLMFSLACTTPSPPRPKMPFTYDVYVNCGKLLSKGYHGFSGGGGGGGSI